MSNASVSVRPARRETISLFAVIVDALPRFFAAVRCANAVETRRKPAAKDLDSLGLRNLL
jgi:hypothetical protein